MKMVMPIADSAILFRAFTVIVSPWKSRVVELATPSILRSPVPASRLHSSVGAKNLKVVISGPIEVLLMGPVLRDETLDVDVEPPGRLVPRRVLLPDVQHRLPTAESRLPSVSFAPDQLVGHGFHVGEEQVHTVRVRHLRLRLEE